MSVKQHINDDEKEIHELPEIATLPEGMMVAVDSERTGTKSFNLTDAFEEKVDSPATSPTTGQVLMFDGTDNTWANPPEGVYVINYSEVTDIRDVDIEKAKTLPTFLKIDTDQPLTISVPQSSGSPYMVSVQSGTIMSLEEIGSNGTSGTYSGPKFLIFGSKFGEEVGGGIMQNADLRVICCIALSAFGGVSKGLTVTGNMDPGGNLFGNINVGTQPFPITTKFFVGKGPGDPNTNRTQNSLGVEFQSAGKIRRQVLMPEDIQSNLFYSNSTPEIIQFMGWGSTSNRAGYRTSLLAMHSSRSSEYPAQTPTVTFNRYVMGSSETSDNVATSVNVEMISSVSGQGSASFGGNLVPVLGTTGALQYWSDNSGTHYGFKPVNEVPASTSSDSGKVLTVAANGTPVWTTIASSPFVLVDRSVSDWYSTIPAIVAAGKIPMFYDTYTYEGVQRNILYVYQYTDTGSNYVFMGTGVKIPDFTPSPKFFYVTYTLDTSTGSGGITGCDSNGIGEETINSTSRLSGDTLSIDNNRAYKITNTSILGKSNLIIKIEDVATSDFAANVSIELTPTANMTLTVKKWNTTLKYSVAGGNQLTAGKTYQVTAFGGCWTMAEFQLPA